MACFWFMWGVTYMHSLHPLPSLSSEKQSEKIRWSDRRKKKKDKSKIITCWEATCLIFLNFLKQKRIILKPFLEEQINFRKTQGILLGLRKEVVNQKLSRKSIIRSYLYYLFSHAIKRLILKQYALIFTWKIIVRYSNKHLAKVLHLSTSCVCKVIMKIHLSSFLFFNLFIYHSTISIHV